MLKIGERKSNLEKMVISNGIVIIVIMIVYINSVIEIVINVIVDIIGIKYFSIMRMSSLSG